MPLEIDLDGDRSEMSLPEFVASLEGRDLNKQDELIQVAPNLKRLANNGRFLLDQIWPELENLGRFQAFNSYGPQVFILHATRSYFIRANIWRPISGAERALPNFKYDICHDHNFDILTVGYFGPGYKSRAYTYDFNEEEQVIGSRVALRPEGIFTLATGKVALYRAKRDVHIQLPPEALSVSINLIPHGPRLKDLQFQFDEADGTILRYLQISAPDLVVRLAGFLPRTDCVHALKQIGESCESPRLRAIALVSQMQNSPDREPEILSKAHPTLLRHLIEHEMRAVRWFPPLGPSSPLDVMGDATGPSVNVR